MEFVFDVTGLVLSITGLYNWIFKYNSKSLALIALPFIITNYIFKFEMFYNCNFEFDIIKWQPSGNDQAGSCLANILFLAKGGLSVQCIFSK